MKIFTQQQEKRLKVNAKKKDGIAYVKLFNPSGGQTWYISEMEIQEDKLIGYGLADLGFGFPEIGSFSLDEIIEMRYPPFGLKVERDKWFKPQGLISILDSLKKGKQI
tara:strand:+ start:590 stop:913 length:324 start_codon:yes stop_codon:yes gene_type:complete